MALPGVKIELQNGQIGSVQTNDDSIAGLILTGTTVSGTDKITVGKAYNIFSLAEAVELGIEETGNNAFAYGQIKEFYDMAGSGQELWLMLVAASVTMEDMLDKSKSYAPVLLDAAKGKIRKLGVSRKSSAGVTVSNGLDSDVDKALIKGNELVKEYIRLFKPFRFLVDGKDFNGNVGDLKDYQTANFNGGGVVLGATSSAKNAAVGFTLGFMAYLPIQRKISRVKNGVLAISKAYLTDGSETEKFANSWESIHDKGYIFFISYVGKSGYFYNGDRTATSLSDDYSSFSRACVIDKAAVIAYQTYIEEIDDELEVDDDGRINAAIVKELQGSIESNIQIQMISAGEATDVSANIDPLQDVITTGELKIELKIRPVGYTSFINILLGFETS